MLAHEDMAAIETVPAAAEDKQPVGSVVKVLDALSNGVGVLCGFCILAMMLIISYEVASRYIFNSPTSWVTEYSLYIFVGASFLAAAFAHVQDSHIRVEILIDRLSDGARIKYLQVAAWIGFLYLIVASWQMILFVISEYRGGAKAWGLLVTPLWIPESFVAAGLCLFTLSVLSEIRKLTPSLPRGRETVGLLIFLLLIVLLFLIGTRPPRPSGLPADWGTLSILFAVLAVSWLWNGPKVTGGTALLSAGGGLLFAFGGSLSTLQQGGLIAFYLLVLLAAGIRIAFALGVVGALGVLFLLPAPQLQAIAEQAWIGVNSFTYTAIPMFILMGAFLLRSGVTSDLFEVMIKWMGRFPGGIAHATVAACGVFAAVSGSSLATAATMGMMAAPEMIRRGYDPRLTYGVVAAGGTLGILIPPSIAMIVYGSLVGEPIGSLFIAGIVPGLLLMVSFMLIVLIWSVFRKDAAPRGADTTWKERISVLPGVLPFLLLIFGVLGSLYLGIATPTEAGAIGALLAGLLCLAKKKMTLKALMECVLETAKVTSFLIIIVTAASVMSYALAYIRLPKILVEVIQGSSLPPGLIMTILVVFYVILGMFIDSISMVLMTWSVSVPVVTALGLHPIWFGVVLVMMIEIGMITPPVGVILFILRGMSGDVDFKEIVLGVLPFAVMFFLLIFLFYLFPEIIMWLPSRMGGSG